MKKYLIFAIITLFVSNSYSDEIHLRDGTVVKGKIIQLAPKYIEYDPEGDKPFDLLPRGQIIKIIYDDGKVINLFEVTPLDQKKQLLKLFEILVMG